jgi:hypothetical protein
MLEGRLDMRVQFQSPMETRSKGVTFFNSGSKSDPTELFSSIV